MKSIKSKSIASLCMALLAWGVWMTGISCSHKIDSQTTITVWSSSNPEEITFVKEHVDKWNAEGNTIPASFQPVPEGQSSEEVILAAVVGKTTPDIYCNMWQGDVEDFARSGVLIPLDTLEGFLDFLYLRCDSATIEEIRSGDGHIYQIPWKVNPVLMMVNTTLMRGTESHGVPSTYEEMLASGQSLKNTGVWLGISEVNAIWWQRFFNFLPLYYAHSKGAPLVKDGKAVFNNEHGVEVFSFLQSLYTNAYFPKEQMKGQTDPFLAGKVAVTFTGPWTIEHNERFKPHGFEYQFYEVPVPSSHTGPIYTYGDPKNIVLFNTCKNPGLAWKLIKSMLTEESDFRLLSLSGQFPRRKNPESNPLFNTFLQERPLLQPFAKQVPFVKGIDSEPYMKEVLDIISQEYELCVVYGKKKPEDAIKDAARAVELLYR